MRIIEIFTLGHYSHSDGCYKGYRDHSGAKKDYRTGSGTTSQYDDRDTPLTKLRGSQI
ncbi:MAG: hypothetical protein ACRDSR_25325 [Pseudonocardiaceae bacterium]